MARVRSQRTGAESVRSDFRGALAILAVVVLAILFLPGEARGITQVKEPDMLGFDRCDTPTTTTMQSWWNNSPYYWFGVYLGGNSLGSGCNPPSGSGWISTVLSQGWDLMPIWVSYQAPCDTSSQDTKMSYDTTTAHTQGEDAAGTAWSTATNTFGLPSGLPIYDDMEAYDTSNTSCVAAVKAFVRGWDDKMINVEGAHAGMYGSSSGSAVSGWASLSPAPTDVYAAAWNGVHNVWNLTGVSNSDWEDDHRSHQYNGNVTQTYGGHSLLIDPGCGLSDMNSDNGFGEDDLEGSVNESNGPTEDASCN